MLDANEPGFGGSTRNGGMVSGGVNVGKRYMAPAMTAEEAAPFLNDGVDALALVENTIEQEKLRLAHGRLFPRRLVQEPL